MRLALIAMSLLLVTTTASAQGTKTTVTREPGGSVRTTLGMGIVLNKESSLIREWIAIQHSGFPADFVGTPGVTTTYMPDRLRGEYQYKTKMMIEAKEPLTALEVRFLLFDVWGRHIKTLSSTDLVDIESGEPGRKFFDAAWRIFSENEASEYFASIAYIARVKTKTGRIVTADIGPVLDEARRFSSKFSADDLEPRPEKK